MFIIKNKRRTILKQKGTLWKDMEQTGLFKV